jgi:hypothetical protein
VTLHHVLDDGQAEAGAASLPGPAAVHAVEAFREPGNVLARDADTAVRHFDLTTAVRP